MSYKEKMPRNWFGETPFFQLYFVREGSSVLMALYCLNLFIGLNALNGGEASWNEWLDWQSTSGMILFSAVSLAGTLVHTITWFGMAPRAMPQIWIGNFRVSEQMIVQGQWVAFCVIALVLLFALSWGG